MTSVKRGVRVEKFLARALAGKKQKPLSAAEKFIAKTYAEADRDYGIFPPPTSAADGLNTLISHFLGENWYSVNPIGAEQIYTEAIYEILQKHPKGGKDSCSTPKAN